jgi:hypothetical protein
MTARMLMPASAKNVRARTQKAAAVSFFSSLRISE